jgi:hypothetical protein
MATTTVPVVLLVYARAASFVPAEKKWKKMVSGVQLVYVPSSSFLAASVPEKKKLRQPAPTLLSFIF